MTKIYIIMEWLEDSYEQPQLYYLAFSQENEAKKFIEELNEEDNGYTYSYKEIELK